MARNNFSQDVQSNFVYVSFSRRFLAWLIDSMVLSFLIGVFILLAGFYDIYTEGLFNLRPPSFKFFGYAVIGSGLLIPWLYYTLLESCFLQATLGKAICQLKVVNLQYQRISFMRASLRYWARAGLLFAWGFFLSKIGYMLIDTMIVATLPKNILLTAVIFNMGAIVDNAFIVFTSQRQALHDLIAKTKVIHVEAKSVKCSKHQIVGLAQLSQDP